MGLFHERAYAAASIAPTLIRHWSRLRIRGIISYLKYEADERGEEVYSKGSVKHS